MNDLPAYGAVINAVVLAGTLIYELTGPVITKWALTKAGEIKAKYRPVQKKVTAASMRAVTLFLPRYDPARPSGIPEQRIYTERS